MITTEELLEKTKNSNNPFIKSLHEFYKKYKCLSPKQIKCLQKEYRKPYIVLTPFGKTEMRKTHSDFIKERQILHSLKDRFNSIFFKHHGGFDFEEQDY